MNEKTHYVSPLPGSQIDTLQADDCKEVLPVKRFFAIGFVDNILEATAAIGHESTVVVAGEGS